MSLVFLKNSTNASDGNNDGHLKPYDWTNYFASTMILPPNAQVAFVSATMSRKKNVVIEEPNNVLYLQYGIPSLNRTMPIYLEQQTQEDYDSIMSELTFNLNKYSGQSDFMTDELIPTYTRGWSAKYSSVTDKITIKQAQRLQPTNFGVKFNNGRDIVPGGAAWGGIDSLGLTQRTAPNGVAFYNMGVPPLPPVNVAVETSVGSSYLVPQNGLPIGTPVRFGTGTWSMWYSETGIKRSMGTAPGGGYGAGVGGSAIISIDLTPQADGATATSEVPNQFLGVQSLQFIKGQEPNEPGSAGFIQHLDINATVGGAGGSQSNSRYTLGVRTDRQNLYVEIQNALSGDANVGGLPALGSCGNSRHSIVYQVPLPTWAAVTGQPAATSAAAFDRKLQFRFRWTSPYCMCVEGSTNYNQDTNAGDWFMLYDMKTGDTPAGAGAATVMYIPSWYGDMATVGYNMTRVRTKVYGNFDVIKCYNLDPTGLFPNYDLMMSKPGFYGGDAIVGSATRWLKTIVAADLPAAALVPPEDFDANGFAEKEIKFVGAPLTQTNSLTEFEKWKPPYAPKESLWSLGQPQTTLGVLMGLIASNVDGLIPVPPDVAGVYSSYGIIGTLAVSEEDIKQSIHIQLTDLPIQSRNGVSSQQTADIAVVHNYGDGGTSVGGKLVYQHYTNEKNWIDLNNIGEMSLNRLRVYCSYDDNKPAVNLIDKTDILIMFRQKPRSDTSIPNQVITPVGVDFYDRNTTTRVM